MTRLMKLKSRNNVDIQTTTNNNICNANMYVCMLYVFEVVQSKYVYFGWTQTLNRVRDESGVISCVHK